jgi:hypothetical protein
MNCPRVSVIILNWNGLADTVECLRSLQEITYPNYNVIVVDNASGGDDVNTLKKTFGDYIEVIRNDRNYGFAAGNNVGIRYALDHGASYVFLLNNDTVVDPLFLGELIDVAEADTGIGIVCPMIYCYYQPDQVWFGGASKIDLWKGTCKEVQAHDSDQPVIESAFAAGTAMLIRREVLERIGPLDERFFFGVEDVDYSIHARREGFRIAVAARARILHKVSSSRGNVAGAGIGYHYRGWQIMRRKYLSTGGYVLSSFYALARATFSSFLLLLHYMRHADCHGITTLLRKMAQSLKGTIWGIFGK